jgi:ribosomal protein S18 acetylase RimI-like enzyme
MQEYLLRPAKDQDAPALSRLVDDAYRDYIERIGRKPMPMTESYAQVIRASDVSVVEKDGELIGAIVLSSGKEGFCIENVAVHPSHQGTGVGQALLRFAEQEARRAGYDSVYLYTHEKMTENQALYGRIGYVEYERREEEGFSRVFMRKELVE